MKKVGIITYHFAKNYGAVLQCYALQFYLTKKGYDVEVFDYVSERQRLNNGILKHGQGIKSLIANICLFPFIFFIKRKNDKFLNFCKTRMYLSPRLTTKEQLKQYINKKGFDYIISGSDQVINPTIADFDLTFLYPFQVDAKKITYAASTGNASKEDIQKISRYLNDFYEVSIREHKDIEKFDYNLTKRIRIVCDPVVLLDVRAWEKMINKSSSKKYLVCYFLHKDILDAEYRASQEIAKKKGLEFKMINARFNKKSLLKGTLLDVGPMDFINLIANADYICTDSFHGTLFSLIFHKRFTCFDTKANSIDNRRKDLLECVCAEQAYQYVEEKIKIVEFIDYSTVEKKIEKMRKKAFEYLEIINE